MFELTGHVRNGVIVLDGDQKLPEGTEVRVITEDDDIPSSRPKLDQFAEVSLLLHQLQEEEDLAKYAHDPKAR